MPGNDPFLEREPAHTTRRLLSKAAELWSPISLREKPIKIGAQVVSHGRYVALHVADVGVSRQMSQEIMSLIARSGHHPCQQEGHLGSDATDGDSKDA